MGYYIRVLSRSAEAAAASIFEKSLSADGRRATISGDIDSSEWQQLVVAHTNGNEVCLIERFPVATTEIGHDEIDGFLEEIDGCLPKSGAEWLTSYLPTIETVYLLQILPGADEAGGWDIVGSVKNALWSFAGGIIQADFEGFTNDEGYHILWQFSDRVTGDWWMAILDDGKWVKFRMDLGDPIHRAAFQSGEVPTGIATID